MRRISEGDVCLQEDYSAYDHDDDSLDAAWMCTGSHRQSDGLAAAQETAASRDHHSRLVDDDEYDDEEDEDEEEDDEEEEEKKEEESCSQRSLEIVDPSIRPPPSRITDFDIVATHFLPRRPGMPVILSEPRRSTGVESPMPSKRGRASPEIILPRRAKTRTFEVDNEERSARHVAVELTPDRRFLTSEQQNYESMSLVQSSLPFSHRPAAVTTVRNRRDIPSSSPLPYQEHGRIVTSAVCSLAAAKTGLPSARPRQEPNRRRLSADGKRERESESEPLMEAAPSASANNHLVTSWAQLHRNEDLPPSPLLPNQGVEEASQANAACGNNDECEHPVDTAALCVTSWGRAQLPSHGRVDISPAHAGRDDDDNKLEHATDKTTPDRLVIAVPSAPKQIKRVSLTHPSIDDKDESEPPMAFPYKYFNDDAQLSKMQGHFTAPQSMPVSRQVRNKRLAHFCTDDEEEECEPLVHAVSSSSGRTATLNFSQPREKNVAEMEPRQKQHMTFCDESECEPTMQVPLGHSRDSRTAQYRNMAQPSIPTQARVRVSLTSACRDDDENECVPPIEVPATYRRVSSGSKNLSFTTVPWHKPMQDHLTQAPSISCKNEYEDECEPPPLHSDDPLGVEQKMLHGHSDMSPPVTLPSKKSYIPVMAVEDSEGECEPPIEALVPHRRPFVTKKSLLRIKYPPTTLRQEQARANAATSHEVKDEAPQDRMVAVVERKKSKAADRRQSLSGSKDGEFDTLAIGEMNDESLEHEQGSVALDNDPQNRCDDDDEVRSTPAPSSSSRRDYRKTFKESSTRSLSSIFRSVIADPIPKSVTIRSDTVPAFSRPTTPDDSTLAEQHSTTLRMTDQRAVIIERDFGTRSCEDGESVSIRQQERESIKVDRCDVRPLSNHVGYQEGPKSVGIEFLSAQELLLVKYFESVGQSRKGALEAALNFSRGSDNNETVDEVNSYSVYPAAGQTSCNDDEEVEDVPNESESAAPRDLSVVLNEKGGTARMVRDRDNACAQQRSPILPAAILDRKRAELEPSPWLHQRRPGRPQTRETPGTTMQRATTPGVEQMSGRAFGQLPVWCTENLTGNHYDDAHEPLTNGDDDVMVDATFSVANDDDIEIAASACLLGDLESSDDGVIYVEARVLDGFKFFFSRDAMSKRICYSVVILAVCVAAAMIIGLTASFVQTSKRTEELFVPTVAPTISIAPTVSLDGYVDIFIRYSSRESLNQRGSPQHSAVVWIANNDQMSLDAGDAKTAQRYAIVVLYYALGGENWLIQDRWLDSTTHECDWGKSVDCKSSFGDRRIAGLTLDNYGLTGSLPPEIRHLDALESFILRMNAIGGSLPTELGHLSALRTIDVSSNLIKGSIPSTIGGLSNLVELTLSYNKLSGEFPSELYNLASLKSLAMESNSLNGTLSNDMSKLTSLVSINAKTNDFTGFLPEWYAGALTNLDLVAFDHNKFSGPVSIHTLAAAVGLVEITASNNLLTGTVPHLQSLFSTNASEVFLRNMKLKKVDLSTNQLNGTFEPSIGLIPTLDYLDFSSNSFTGQLPSSLALMSTIEHIDFSDNQFTGTFPILTSQQLKYVSVNNNDLRGGIPTDIGLLSSLELLDIGGNELLEGTIPTELGSLAMLKYLYLESAGLIGQIPSSIFNVASIEQIKLGGNKMTGEIPSEIGTLSLLSVLSLEDNRFHGMIPTYIGNATNLGILRLTKNLVTGPIPTEVGLLTDLNDLELSRNLISGSVPDTVCNLKSSGQLSTMTIDCQVACSCCSKNECESF